MSTSKKRTRQQYLRIFLQYDADNSGSISKNQIIKMFKACQLEIDPEEVQDLMNQINIDEKGQVRQDQFIELLRREDQKIEYTVQECRKLFGYFVDEGQTIGFQQLKLVMQCLGEEVTEKEVAEMIIYGDKNRDGRLDFNQFYKMIMMM